MKQKGLMENCLRFVNCRCKDGNGTFDEIYTRHSSIVNQKCSNLITLEVPSKETIQELLSHAATAMNFNPDCKQNKQLDDSEFDGDGFYYNDDDDDDDGTVSTKLSPTQRFTVCNLRKKSKTRSVIAKMIKVDETLIGTVRCKPGQSSKRIK